VQLAMSGKAFRILAQEGVLIRKILHRCQVFARMTPVDKTDCVELFMEKTTTAMCGDGGNDCGALRAAHVGMAMSDGEASIVSPFSTKDHSVNSCVTLLREGRCCLATSFFTYDFILTYGETIVWSKLFYLYFGCQLADKVWILFEGIFVPCFTFTLSQSPPAAKLAPRRPTARLLGTETIVTVSGIIIINFCYMCVAYGALAMQDFYLCNEWDASKEDLSAWWLLADNFEGSTVGLLVMMCVLTVAAAGNFSAEFRASWCVNWIFVLTFFTFYVIVSYITLADPNELGCWFRFNCGDPEVLAGLSDRYFYSANKSVTYENVKWTGEKYNSKIGHNVFPVNFRWTLWGIAMADMVTVCAYVRFGVIGPIRAACRQRFGTKKVAATKA